jgi:hypothetical protein
MGFYPSLIIRNVPHMVDWTLARHLHFSIFYEVFLSGLTGGHGPNEKLYIVTSVHMTSNLCRMLISSLFLSLS